MMQLERWEFVEMEVGKTVVVDDPAGAFSVTAYDANHCPGNLFVLNCSTSAHVHVIAV
jgi:DNA cross-link repair 1A protein